MYPSDNVHFLLTLHNILLTVHKFLLALNTFSQSIADVTFLILQTFFSNLSSYCKWGSLILYTLHCTTFSLYCRCNPPGAAYFSSHIADVTFLTLQTLYSNQTLSPPAAKVVILILYIILSHCTKFLSYCRCDLPGTVHFLYSYFRCDIPDTADFLLTPHTLSSYCRCNPSDAVHFLLTLNYFLIILQTRPSMYHTLSLFIPQMRPSWYYRVSPRTRHLVILWQM